MTSTSNSSPWTIPNILCLSRIVGSVILIALAWAGYETAAFALVVFLLLTDWLDGKVAVYFDQRTPIGATIDTFADLTMYVCVIVAVAYLHAEIIERNRVWLIGVGVFYVLAVVLSYIKFRRWPSYHARSAKVSWLAAGIAIVTAFMDWANWPIRLATCLAMLASLEVAAITLVLRRPEVDVPSVFHAMLLRQGQAPPEKE